MDPTSLILTGIVIGVIITANLGERRRGWRVAAYVMTVLLGAGSVTLGLFYLLLGFLLLSSPMMLPRPRLAGANPTVVGLWLVAGGVLSWVALLPAVRRAVARLIPLRADSIVNAVALALLVLLLAQSAALGGLGPQSFVALTGQLTAGQVVLSEVPLALIGIFGVGLLVRRSSPATWQRLGIGGLSWAQVGASLGGVVVLLLYGFLVDLLASRISPQAFEQLSRATRQLYAGLGTPLAALAVSAASGTAEELLFRGAIQPRFGLILTAFTFGFIHSQYGILFALASVGVVGLVLGVYRQRINTTSCILIHGLYNLALFLLSRP